MLPSQSPFPCHWWGIGLENVGLVDVRPEVGTYGRYEFERLPSIPFPMRGDFAWLALASTRDQYIGNERSVGNPKAIQLLLRSSNNLGLRLPEAITVRHRASVQRAWENVIARFSSGARTATLYRPVGPKELELKRRRDGANFPRAFPASPFFIL